jgi:hypothetical protein
MDCLVTARAPTGPARKKWCMISTADQNLPGRGLLLEMAAETEVLISLNEHLVVDRAVRFVAGGATFANRFVLEHERPALRDMTFGAGIHLRSQGERTGFDRVAFVGVMAIAAGHLPLHDRVRVRQAEFPAHIQVALETGFGRFVRVNNRPASAPGFRMHTAGAMTAFAADILGIDTLRLNLRVRGGPKILGDLGMALGAGF